MSEWISVEDDLPGADRPVLIANKQDGFNFQGIASFHHRCGWRSLKNESGYFNQYWSGCDISHSLFNVTHWQPLPEPPPSSPTT